MEARPNSVIKDYVTSADSQMDWKYRDIVQFFYSVYDVAQFYFFSAQTEQQPSLPQSVIAVDEMRHDTLAAYRITYNPNGLPFEIIMNAKWIDRPQWELCESLVHETTHLYQEYMADQGVPGMEHCKNGYHNKQFVQIAEEIGLHPLVGVGSHWRPADGQFARLMELLSIAKPEHANGEFVRPSTVRGKPYWWDGSRGRKPGQSTLLAYTADGCTREPICKLRAGRKDLRISCLDCGSDFAPR